jgi:hypothetical protein
MMNSLALLSYSFVEVQGTAALSLFCAWGHSAPKDDAEREGFGPVPLGLDG